MRRLAPFLLVILGAMTARCGPPADQVRAGGGPGDLRIVSVSPAISRTLVDLGLGGEIVGRTRFGDFLDPETPIVGDLLDVDYESLLRARPTHVLVQAAAAGIDPQLARLGVEHGWTIETWTSVDSIADIKRMVGELPDVLAAEGTERNTALRLRADALTARIDATLRAPPESDGAVWMGPTLLVYATEPVGIFGRGTYLSEVLTVLGATNAADVEAWAEISLEDVTRLNPGAIILVRAGETAPIDPVEAAGPLARLEIDAARDGRIAVLTHPDGLRPCTGVIGVAEEMRAVLGQLAGAPERSP